MTRYLVKIDGETVWTGEGEGVKAIPPEYLTRPADARKGKPHPPAVHLFAVTDDDEEVLIGVQISQAEEDASAASGTA